jgi:hypothetical protein
VANVRWMKLAEGTVISTQGHIAPYIAFIHEGTCNITRSVSPEFRKQTVSPVVVSRVGAGTLLGQKSLSAPPLPETYSVVCESKVILLVLDPENVPSMSASLRLPFVTRSGRVFIINVDLDTVAIAKLQDPCLVDVEEISQVLSSLSLSLSPSLPAFFHTFDDATTLKAPSVRLNTFNVVFRSLLTRALLNARLCATGNVTR